MGNVIKKKNNYNTRLQNFMKSFALKCWISKYIQCKMNLLHLDAIYYPACACVSRVCDPLDEKWNFLFEEMCMTELNFRQISFFYRKFGSVIYQTCTGWIRYTDAGHIEKPARASEQGNVIGLVSVYIMSSNFFL